jgi:integrase/recombinase XerD
MLPSLRTPHLTRGGAAQRRDGDRVAMGMRRDPVVRLCAGCGQLKAANQFEPGRPRKCLACRQAQPSRTETPDVQHDPPAVVRARARDQARQRLRLEHLDAYRELYRAERRAIPDTVPADRAHKQAVSRALRALERQHRPRYAELYREEFKRARSQPHLRPTGRPSGSPEWTGGAEASRSRGPSRHPAIPDSQLPAIEQAVLEEATAHPASAGDSLAAAAALADLDGVPDGMPGLARSNRPASPAERQDAIAQAWQDEPGITDTALAERFGVSRQLIRRDIQALQERGIQRRTANRRHRSDGTQAQYAAVHRRFLDWLADELGRPSTPQDLSDDVLARWIAQRATAGGHGGRGLSPASLRQECSALRQLVRHVGRPELAASLHASRQDAPPPETISPAQYERLLREPDLTTRVGVRDRAILRLLGDVGLRPSEVCALTLGDVIWSGDGQLPVLLEVAWGKGRLVQLTAQASAAVADWLPHHPAWQPDARGWELPAAAPLFVALGRPKPARRAVTEIALLTRVLRLAQQAGIPAHLRYPYVLRHYWATRQVVGGITPAQLQARGGWQDRRSAQAYFREPPAAAALAAALGLDRETPPAR